MQHNNGRKNKAGEKERKSTYTLCNAEQIWEAAHDNMFMIMQTMSAMS